ncbi:polysaccharide deacetylase family protein [Hydrotalea sp.]|uniref:polysaccharide deacetylase family protein n=1 Tax=Hydrotalea sp. TaxID=2881279 RepID=UPI0026087180|nr:polysaccharide deacetylase family protein [Hydrotalea sp.]
MKKIIVFILVLSVHFKTNAQILKQHIPDKLVVFTFDDAPVTQFTYAAPLLKQYGFGATFFVCEFPPNYHDSTKYMTWSQMQQLGKTGFEVANHTHTHASVIGLSQQQFADQLKYIEDKCDSLKIGKPVTFAYPGYDVDSSAFATLKKRGYLFARAGAGRAYDPLSDYPYLVPGWSSLTSNEAQIMNAFKQAKDGKIVVITFHGIPDYEHSWVTTPPELFKKYLQYLYNNHYKVIALKDLADYIHVKKALIEIKPDFKKKLKD